MMTPDRTRKAAGTGGATLLALWPLALGMVLFALAPAVLNQGLVFLAGLVLVNIVFAQAWNLLFAYAGLLSFGQAMFFAVGAYTMAAGPQQLGGGPFLGWLLIATLLGALAAIIFGLVALRRSGGIYFAVLTLAFAELVHVIITKTDWLGRNDGLVGITRPVIDLGVITIDLTRGDAYYYAMILGCGLASAALWWAGHGVLGRSFRAIRQDPVRAAFLGLDVDRHRLIAFAISGAASAFAGAMFAPWTQIVTPELAHWSQSTRPVLYALLGGAGSFWGPAVGAILFGAVEYATRTMHGIADITTGLMLLAVVLAIPGGVMGLVMKLRGRAAARSTATPSPASGRPQEQTP
ncbi:branched-chain amino acid ABC transporter permease [Tistrella bauzanensis]|uniref:Branched-chain amino acid ABC transporter permease n=1 Tax=Tistrella bauzanensis TaxID=657419 RepID=A0ABQ1IJH2_9PROT|nr:branched-chain amino acid ABC transporter permease [Tistrella bauzanensis]GGB44465.1 branched-chain amino acid ABC transporter permease [Tistrella bauzanensis]